MNAKTTRNRLAELALRPKRSRSTPSRSSGVSHKALADRTSPLHRCFHIIMAHIPHLRDDSPAGTAPPPPADPPSESPLHGQRYVPLQLPPSSSDPGSAGPLPAERRPGDIVLSTFCIRCAPAAGSQVGTVCSPKRSALNRTCGTGQSRCRARSAGLLAGTVPFAFWGSPFRVGWLNRDCHGGTHGFSIRTFVAPVAGKGESPRPGLRTTSRRRDLCVSARATCGPGVGIAPPGGAPAAGARMAPGPAWSARYPAAGPDPRGEQRARTAGVASRERPHQLRVRPEWVLCTRMRRLSGGQRKESRRTASVTAVLRLAQQAGQVGPAPASRGRPRGR